MLLVDYKVWCDPIQLFGWFQQTFKIRLLICPIKNTLFYSINNSSNPAVNLVLMKDTNMRHHRRKSCISIECVCPCMRAHTLQPPVHIIWRLQECTGQKFSKKGQNNGGGRAVNVLVIQRHSCGSLCLCVCVCVKAVFLWFVYAGCLNEEVCCAAAGGVNFKRCTV